MALVSEARLHGLVLGSSDPKRLAAWYQAAFTPDVEVTDSVLQLSKGALIFEQRDDVAPQAAEPGRIIVNIQVDELPVLVAHLEALDPEWVRPVEQIPVGTIATVKDADGNFVNILELNE
jgi:predicted enzyme related to lactoylglutathione lyase